MEYKENSASHEQILAHLKACDAEFYRALCNRVDIQEYSHKLAVKAFRHEAWSGEDMVGLVAVYYNHDPSGFDFITDVSVVQSSLGQGIASRLLEACINKAKNGGSAELKLEVGAENEAALKLYSKFGFTSKSETETGLVLSLQLLNSSAD